MFYLIWLINLIWLILLDLAQFYFIQPLAEPPPSLDILAEDYKKLVNDETFSDVEFRIGKQIVYAHKVILSARCDYFRAMFQHDMKESSRV